VKPIVLSDGEVVELFRVLKPQERNLPTAALVLLNRLEKQLYQTLTIDEVENLLPAAGPR
jgi:hypothetical protein